jgi:polar amino acid transport system permease protein
MATSITDLGPFAPESGARSSLALGGAIAGIASIAFAVARGVGDAIGTGPHALTTLSLAAGALGVALGLLGLYDTAARGRAGRDLVRAALVCSIAGGLGGFVYGAAHAGTLRLDNFSRAYFDFHLMRVIARPLLHGLLNTLLLAAAGEALAILVGLAVATMELSPRAWLRRPAVAYVDLVRGLPLVVLTSLIFGGLPKLGIVLQPFTAAVLTLTINASAYVAEIFRAGIQSLPRGQTEAARSLGMTQGVAMMHVVIPQAVRAVIPPLMSEFIALVKDTAIVLALIGFTVQSADLFGSARTSAASTFSPTPYVAAAIGYLIVTVPLARLVGRVERKLRAGLA